ncbi:craniofacial development protein 2-like [Artemia franciscana]|uniref:craniofacial development protein 2-like n=1 Tax=Artemia franciscana TaxID=6661 RepID=UPI0032D9D921
MTTPGRDEVTLRLISTKTLLNIGTLNTRTLVNPGKMDLLLRELNRYKWDLVGLSETHLPRTGEETICGTYLLLSGRTDGTHRQGVGFILSPSTKNALISSTPVSERKTTIRLKGSVSNLTIIQLYATDTARSDKECEQFYFQLQSVTDQTPKKDMLIVMADLNAITDNDQIDRRDVMGSHGHGRLNGRGERLISFCRENDLYITNSAFKHGHRRKVTWRSPNGVTENMIDYVLISKRWKSSIMDTVSLPGADFDSDHSLLMSKLKLRLKRLHKTTRIPRFWTELLRDPIKKGAYTTSLSSKFRAIKENFTSLTTVEEIDQLTEHPTSAVLETANDVLGRKTKDEKPWITEEIIQQCNQKRLCNNKADPCSRDTYKYLNRRIDREV